MNFYKIYEIIRKKQLNCPKVKVDVQYRAFLSQTGWTDYVPADEICGSDTTENYVQAIQIKLVGEEK